MAFEVRFISDVALSLVGGVLTVGGVGDLESPILGPPLFGSSWANAVKKCALQSHVYDLPIWQIDELASLFGASDEPPSRAQLHAMSAFYDADTNGVCVCVCVCVCVRERERERESVCECVCWCVSEKECVCVCVCEREKEGV